MNVSYNITYSYACEYRADFIRQDDHEKVNRAYDERLEKLEEKLAEIDDTYVYEMPSEPIEGTCSWIMKNETCQAWLSEDSGMLWVRSITIEVKNHTRIRANIAFTPGRWRHQPRHHEHVPIFLPAPS